MSDPVSTVGATRRSVSMVMDPSTPPSATSAARRKPKRSADGEIDRQTHCGRRESVCEASIQQTGQSSNSLTPMASGAEAETSQLAAEDPPPAGALTAAAVAERAAKKFVIGTPAVVASKMGRAADIPTNLLVYLVEKVVSAWSKEHVDALSRSFGNFDRIVARGWLVVDALGRPLIEHKQALKLGFDLQYRAKKIRKQVANLLASGQDAAFLHAAVVPALILPDAAPATACGKRAHGEVETALPLWRLRAATKRATAEEAAAFAAWDAAGVAWDAANAAAEKRWAECEDAYDAVFATHDALHAAGIQARVGRSEAIRSQHAHQMARVEQALARHTAAEEELERADVRQSHARERCVAALEATRTAREQQIAAEHEAAQVDSEAAYAAQDAAYAAQDAAFNSALKHARQVLDRTSILCREDQRACNSMEHTRHYAKRSRTCVMRTRSCEQTSRRRGSTLCTCVSHVPASCACMPPLSSGHGSSRVSAIEA